MYFGGLAEGADLAERRVDTGPVLFGDASHTLCALWSGRILALVPLPAHLTVTLRNHYIQRMATSSDKSFERELQRLERRLDELVVITNQLKEENRSLKQRQDALIGERATLLQKNEQVRARVEAMIGRLKAMEHGS
jgi:cell division protein ZapB